MMHTWLKKVEFRKDPSHYNVSCLKTKTGVSRSRQNISSLEVLWNVTSPPPAYSLSLPSPSAASSSSGLAPLGLRHPDGPPLDHVRALAGEGGGGGLLLVEGDEGEPAGDAGEAVAHHPGGGGVKKAELNAMTCSHIRGGGKFQSLIELKPETTHGSWTASS